MNDSNCLDQVKAFFSEELCIPVEKIHANSSLFHDFGVDGDDAIEILGKFSVNFGVDISSINLDDYFGPEAAANPISFFCEIFSKGSAKDIKRLEINELVEMVNAAQEK
ncbi:DUF1493 family protein [Microbulbifer sp. 2201CG32-9]|uniref:DUF1493 family protein n=1 Tax=Microbulbifer sp. 2201CG32-9 TaxID=3232309 RepID=UPI00345C49CE